MAINTADLVGNSGRPLVTPQATEQLTDAFRKGFITADDIMERVSERTRAKQELELVTAKQGIAEATNPDLIQAKKNQQLAAGAQAKSALALNPLAEQAKTAELKAAIYDAKAKPGGFDVMQNALSKAGFPVSIDPNIGLTDANKAEILKRFAALDVYVLKRADAEDRVKSTETKFFPTEQKLPDGSTTKGQLQKLFRNGQEITSDEFKNSAKEAEALKRTPFSQWYSLQATTPGQVAAPVPAPAAPALIISPIEAGQQRAQLSNQGVPNAASLSDQQVAQLIQPRAAAPVAMPVITPTLGQTSPGLGIITSIEAAGPAKGVAMSSEQQKGLAQAALTNLQIQDLSKSLEAVIKNSPKLTGPIQGRMAAPFHPENWDKEYGNFVRAQTAILANLAKGIYHETGVLSDQDIERYKKALPSTNDTPEVAREKLAGSSRDIYNSILSNIETMKGQGQAVTPIIESMQQSAKEALANLAAGTTPAVPTGATENTAVVGGKTYKVRIDPATGQKKYFIVQ